MHDAEDGAVGFRQKLFFRVSDQIEGVGVGVEEHAVKGILDQPAGHGVVEGLEEGLLLPDGVVGAALFRDVHDDAVDDGFAVLVLALAARVPHPDERTVLAPHAVFGGVGQGVGEAALAVAQGLRKIRRVDQLGHPSVAHVHQLGLGVPEHPAQPLVDVIKGKVFVVPVGLEPGVEGPVQVVDLAGLFHEKLLEVLVALFADPGGEVLVILHFPVGVGNVDEVDLQLVVHDGKADGHPLVDADDVAGFRPCGDPAAARDDAGVFVP